MQSAPAEPARRLILIPGAAMVDSFVFQIDWATVASVIGLLASLGAVFVYARRVRD